MGGVEGGVGGWTYSRAASDSARRRQASLKFPNSELARMCSIM